MQSSYVQDIATNLGNLGHNQDIGPNSRTIGNYAYEYV